MLPIVIADYTTKGVRSENQDYYSVETLKKNNAGLRLLAIVADGMGGMAAGSVASKLAVKNLKEQVLLDLQKESPLIKTDIDFFFSLTFKHINETIISNAQHNPEREGMGTTLVCALLFENNDLYFANVGDSRGYILYKDELIKITEDHNAGAEAKKNGTIAGDDLSLYPYANALTRSLGDEIFQEADIFGPHKFSIDQTILLSTDGLHGFVDDSTIFSLLSEKYKLNDKITDLAQTALQNGSNDNITIVGIHSGKDHKKHKSKKVKPKSSSKRIIILSFIALILLAAMGYVGYLSYNIIFEEKANPVTTAVDNEQIFNHTGVSTFSVTVPENESIEKENLGKNKNSRIKFNHKEFALQFGRLMKNNTVVDLSKDSNVVLFSITKPDLTSENYKILILKEN